METGTVKFFTVSGGMNYGFIRKADGEEVFFHLNEYRRLSVNKFDGSIFFQEAAAPPRNVPASDDIIVFEETCGKRGLKARRWAYQAMYVRAQQVAKSVIAELSIVYRVMHQYTLPGQKKLDPDIKFEGTLGKLNRQHPRPRENPHRRDELWHTYGGNDLDVVIWFERFDGNEWIHCDDPRTAIVEDDIRMLRKRGNR